MWYIKKRHTLWLRYRIIVGWILRNSLGSTRLILLRQLIRGSNEHNSWKVRKSEFSGTCNNRKAMQTIKRALYFYSATRLQKMRTASNPRQFLNDC